MGSSSQTCSTRLAVAAGLGLSLGLHLMAYAAIPQGQWDGPRPVDELDVTVVDQTPEPEPEPEPKTDPEPETVAAPPPEPPPKPREKIVRKRDVPEPEPDTPPPPAEETPVRFDDVTLTNEGQRSSWSTYAGSGEASDGPLAPPGLVTGRRAKGVVGGVPGGTGQPRSGPPVVPYGDLSKPPQPPDQGTLDTLLARHFKRIDAYKAGVRGRAKVRFRVEPDGRVRRVQAQSESVEGYGLGAACERMLLETRWTPPVDRDGRKVATWATFNCDFSHR
jgi:outer membrane biosynthesis protein TonB